MSLVVVQPGAERVRMNGSKPWMTLSTGSIQAKGATVAPSYNKRHRDAPRVCTMEEKALWIQNDESECMMQQDTSQICGLEFEGLRHLHSWLTGRVLPGWG